MPDLLTIRQELIRKTIHLSCSVIPLLYYYMLDRELVIVISSLITVGFAIAEILRYRSEKFKKLFERIFLPLLREEEKSGSLTGATLLFLAVTVSLILFSKTTAITAILILTVADSMAAVIGKAYGRHRLFNKSLEGSITFLIISGVIVFLFSGEFYWKYLIYVVILTIIEAAPLYINDNIVLPVAAGIMIDFC